MTDKEISQLFKKHKQFFKYAKDFEKSYPKICYQISYFVCKKLYNNRSELLRSEAEYLTKKIEEMRYFVAECKKNSVNLEMKYDEYAQFVENLFLNLDEVDRTETVNYETAGGFKLVADLIDVMVNFGQELNEKMRDISIQYIKLGRYSKFKYVDISKSLDDGVEPQRGGPRNDNNKVDNEEYDIDKEIKDLEEQNKKEEIAENQKKEKLRKEKEEMEKLKKDKEEMEKRKASHQPFINSQPQTNLRKSDIGRSNSNLNSQQEEKSNPFMRSTTIVSKAHPFALSNYKANETSKETQTPQKENLVNVPNPSKGCFQAPIMNVQQENNITNAYGNFVYRYQPEIKTHNKTQNFTNPRNDQQINLRQSQQNPQYVQPPIYYNNRNLSPTPLNQCVYPNQSIEQNVNSTKVVQNIETKKEKIEEASQIVKLEKSKEFVFPMHVTDKDYPLLKELILEHVRYASSELDFQKIPASIDHVEKALSYLKNIKKSE